MRLKNFLLLFISCLTLAIFFAGCVTVPSVETPRRKITTRIKISPVALKKIVIDPGHGGSDPGAIGRTGLREKSVNLDIAKRLAEILEDSGVKVVMTRKSDIFIPLSQRVDIANQPGVDLFISIHSNANHTKSLNGFEIYYISANNNDNRRALYAAEHFSLNLDKKYFGGNSLDLKATLWDMIYTANRQESVNLARTICRSVDQDLETRVIGVKGANFYVLKGARIPAVLVEIGFLSNAQEERLLKSVAYRQQITESIAQGVADYSHKYYRYYAGAD